MQPATGYISRMRRTEIRETGRTMSQTRVVKVVRLSFTHRTADYGHGPGMTL